MRVRQGLRKRPPESTTHVYHAGDSVYVYREKLKHWSGPHIIAKIDGKEVAVHLGEATGPRSFNVSQIKPSLLSAPIQFISSVCANNESRTSSIYWTEIIDKGDPRAKSPAMRNAIKQEIRSLIERGTFRLALLPDRSGKNIVPSKFVLAVKHTDGRDIYKARFCLGGHRDFLKSRMVHTATTLSQTSIRLILALASVLNYDVWTTDVN
jgi:hypothetical protein